MGSSSFIWSQTFMLHYRPSGCRQNGSFEVREARGSEGTRGRADKTTQEPLLPSLVVQKLLSSPPQPPQLQSTPPTPTSSSCISLPTGPSLSGGAPFAHLLPRRLSPLCSGLVAPRLVFPTGSQCHQGTEPWSPTAVSCLITHSLWLPPGP